MTTMQKRLNIQTIILIVSTLLATGAAWGVFTTTVQAIKDDVSELQKIVAQYPSQAYFDLRFGSIEKRLDNLER